MSRVFITLFLLGVCIYGLVDVTRSQRDEVRILPKALWAVLILVLGVLGVAVWMLFGRPKAGYEPPGGSSGPEGPGGAGGLGGPGPRRGGPAPDDDPEFLRRLDEQAWSKRMEQMRRERQAHHESHPDEGEQPPPG